MEIYQSPKTWKVFISLDQADAAEAEKLRDFLTENYKNTHCELEPQYEDNDIKTKTFITNSIRACDLFVLLLSKNSRSPNGHLETYLGWKYSEALNFSKRIKMIFLFLDDPNIFSPVFLQTISDIPVKTNKTKFCSQIFPQEGDKGLNYMALTAVLEELKIPKAYIPNEEYDIFICYKTEDYEYARIVYDMLVSKGFKVFFSKETLPKLGSAEYHEQIMQAIEQSRHMVLVVSSKENAESRWVKYEWRLFLGAILAGRKNGNLISVLAGKMRAEKLPIDLLIFEAIPLVRGEIERLIFYIDRDVEGIPKTFLEDIKVPDEEKQSFSEGDQAGKKPGEDISSYLRESTFENLQLSELLILDHLYGKPDISWTAQLIKDSIISLYPSLEIKSSQIQTAIHSLIEKGYFKEGVGNRLTIGDRTATYYRELKQITPEDQSKTEDFWRFNRLAKSGNAKAQLRLGYCYLTGEGVMKSRIKALKYFSRSANQGINLAKKYLRQFLDAI